MGRQSTMMQMMLLTALSMFISPHATIAVIAIYSMRFLVAKVIVFKKRKGSASPLGIGKVILALGIAVGIILVAILVGGVLADAVGDVFADVGLNGTTWDTLKTTAVNYSTNAIQIALVGIILTGVAVLLFIVFKFANVGG